MRTNMRKAIKAEIDSWRGPEMAGYWEIVRVVGFIAVLIGLMLLGVGAILYTIFNAMIFGIQWVTAVKVLGLGLGSIALGTILFHRAGGQKSP